MNTNRETVVLKFGGASVATPAAFAHVAALIIEKVQQNKNVVVVVSAMANKTDELISLAHQVHPSPPKREYDMLVTVGERISISLLAMALSAQGQQAISFTGSQSGIITSDHHADASIIDIKPRRLLAALNEKNIVIVAGFQGVSRSGEITTLGRGGSDTSAVALGAALGASVVEFYKDVPGIFSDDPKIHATATHHSHLSYSEALNIVDKGAKILHPRSIRLAKKNGVPLHVRSFLDQGKGTTIGDKEMRRAVTDPSFEEERHEKGDTH